MDDTELLILASAAFWGGCLQGIPSALEINILCKLSHAVSKSN